MEYPSILKLLFFFIDCPLFTMIFGYKDFCIGSAQDRKKRSLFMLEYKKMRLYSKYHRNKKKHNSN